MTLYDDDTNVSGNDLHDIVTMAMARRTLRGLVPDAPPPPSEQLAVVLRDGLMVTPPGFGWPKLGWHRLTGRLASLGLAAKLALAAGVAVASAGGAATAVAFTHEDSHHGDHPDSPRNHPSVVIPTTVTGSHADDQPNHGGNPAASTTETERHGGTGDATSGHDGTSGEHSGSGTDDSTSGSHDSGSGSGSDDSTSGSSDGGGSGSTSGGDSSGSTSTSSGSTDTSGGSSGGDGSGSGSDSGSGSGSTSGSDGGTSGGTSDGGGSDN